MDTVVAEIETRLESYKDHIEVAVLGCAVNGIGEASHADFGITGAKNEGLIFAHGKPLRKVPQERLVDELFVEIDKSIDRGEVEVDQQKAAEGAAWLEKIENENAGELTPERLAKLEAEQARAQANAEAAGNGGNGHTIELPTAPEPKKKLDEAVSPTAGRRFTRGLIGFPNPVNEKAARVVAGGVVLLAVTAIVFELEWLLPLIALGFLARVVTGPTLSPLGQLATGSSHPGSGRRSTCPARPSASPRRWA